MSLLEVYLDDDFDFDVDYDDYGMQFASGGGGSVWIENKGVEGENNATEIRTETLNIILQLLQKPSMKTLYIHNNLINENDYFIFVKSCPEISNVKLSLTIPRKYKDTSFATTLLNAKPYFYYVSLIEYINKAQYGIGR